MRVGRLRGMMRPVKPRLRASLIAIGFPLLLLFATSAAATTATYTGSVSATGVKWQFKTLSVAGSGPLTETLTWSTPTAQLQVGGASSYTLPNAAPALDNDGAGRADAGVDPGATVSPRRPRRRDRALPLLRWRGPLDAFAHATPASIAPSPTTRRHLRDHPRLPAPK